jgi:hypothetical protein
LETKKKKELIFEKQFIYCIYHLLKERMDKLVLEIHSSTFMYMTTKSKNILEQRFVELGYQGYIRQATRNIK